MNFLFLRITFMEGHTQVKEEKGSEGQPKGFDKPLVALSPNGPWVNEDIGVLRMYSLQEIIARQIVPAVQRVLKRKARDLPVKCRVPLHHDLHLLICDGQEKKTLNDEARVAEWFGTLCTKKFRAGSYARIGTPVSIYREREETVISLYYAVYTSQNMLLWPEM